MKKVIGYFTFLPTLWIGFYDLSLQHGTETVFAFLLINISDPQLHFEKIDP